MYVADLPLHNSIKVGDIYLPPKNIEAFVSRSVRLLTFEVDQCVSFFGSCTLFQWKGQKFAVATRHQLEIPRGFEFSEENLKYVRIAATENGMLANVLVDACTFEKANPDQEFHDLVIFHVAADNVQTTAQPFSYFPIFEIRKYKYFFSFCVGYPTFQNSMDYDTKHLKAVCAIMNCKLDQEYRSSADYFERYIGNDVDFDFDGFSGGAVFSLLQNSNGYEIGLSGIIVRAGRGQVYIVSSDFLRTIC